MPNLQPSIVTLVTGMLLSRVTQLASDAINLKYDNDCKTHAFCKKQLAIRVGVYMCRPLHQ